MDGQEAKSPLGKQIAPKQRPPLHVNTVPKHSKLAFSNDSVSVASGTSSQVTLRANPVSLEYDPHKEFPRTTRVIKHSQPKYIIDTDYPDHTSVSSIERSILSSAGKKSRKQFPEYASLNSTNSPAYWKGKSNGRMRKVTLAKLEHLTGSLDRPLTKDSLSGFENESLSLTSMQSKSVDDLFSSVFKEREDTTKQLANELCFTSKVSTPRLLKTDPEAHFKSKDLLNGLIEDVSMMSISSLGTKGQSMDEGGSVGTLKEWRRLYETEKSNYDSVAVYAEIRYLELKAQERAEGSHPTKLKATVCADLLLKLCSSTGRLAKVMMPILWEVLNCVFIGFSAQEEKLRADDGGTLQALYGMTTYFDKHRAQLELYDDIHNELEMVQQGKKMEEIVKKFQTVRMVFHAANFYHRDCAFFLWKGELLRAKHRRSVAYRRSLLYRWRQWRAYLQRFKVEETEDMDTELDRKLESLSRLQMLLQAHSSPAPSPKHVDMPLVKAGSRSSKVNLAPVTEGTEEGAGTTTSTATAPEAGTSAKISVAPDLGGDGVTATQAGSPKLYGSPKSMVKTGSATAGTGERENAPSPPPMSPAPLTRGSSGKFMRDRSSVLPVLMRAPTAPLPLSAREIKKQQEAKLAARKQLLLQVDNSIRNTLSAFPIPVMEDSAALGIQPSLGTDSFADGEGADGAGSAEAPQRVDSVLSSSSRSTKSTTGLMTVDLLKEAALIASAAVCPRKDQFTQTPDVWMTNVNEQPFATPAGPAVSAQTMIMRGSSFARPGLSRQNSGVRGNLAGNLGSPGPALGKSLPAVPGKEEGRVDIGGYNPPPFKLETAAACQLITFIYSMKLKDGLQDHDEINFSECLPLLEYTKEVMLKRYGLKRLADKFYRGLVACVIKEGILHRRLETFASLCGITLDGHKEGHGTYTEIQCSFYFRALGIIFGQNTHLLEECMNSFEIDREIILEVLPDLFPAIEKHNSELAKSIMFEVVDLPRNTPGNELEYKVNFDDLMGLLMDYFDDEHKYDPEDAFLYEPLIPPPPEAPAIITASPGTAKPQSPEQLQALVTLTDFTKPKVSLATPKRIRVVHPSQHLV